MSDGITLDSREWNQAVTEYAAATDKTLSDANNRQILNLAIHGVKEQKRAQVALIAALNKLDWWPKFIAYLIGKQAGKGAAAKTFKSMWAAGEKAKYRKGAFRLDREERAYVKMARAKSAQIIARRRNAQTFLKAFFVQLGNAIKPHVPGSTMPKGGAKSVAGMKISASPATPRNLSASAEVVYDYKARGETTAKGAERLLAASLEKAIPATIADMQAYTEKRMGDDARRYSAK